jgi:SAM-dependent methyltransferase
MALPGPNAEHIRIWNEILVPKLVRFRDVFVTAAQAHSSVALASSPPGPGERVLDVGCGFGETSIDLARQVGPSGAVVGIDCCEPLLQVGQADALAAGVGNVTFLCADAQVHPFEPSFDLCFSRFGLMFFQSPVVALRNLRGALRPGGRVLAITWRVIEDNPWVHVPKQIARRHLPPPADSAPTCGPGPFSMADPDTVGSIFAAAGFIGLELTRIDAEVLVGRTIDEALSFQLALGPAGEIVREAGELGAERRPAIEADLRAEIERCQGPAGVHMGSSSWAIRARTA